MFNLHLKRSAIIETPCSLKLKIEVSIQNICLNLKFEIEDCIGRF